MKQVMCCQRCGNTNKELFFNDRGIWYCRRCIAFGRINVNERPVSLKWKAKTIACSYQLPYELTNLQKQVVQQVCHYLENKENVLIYAATGAGKTELTMEAICRYIQEGKKVGFAISRRQVVLEIAQRMQEAFPMLNVIAVCEGYTSVIQGDLIVCTMHQLYRYYGVFDLLIMDEVDAFPYRGNALLKTIAMNACVGEILYLTATPDQEMIKEVKEGKLKEVTLFERPHAHPLVIPKLLHAPAGILHLFLIRFLFDNHHKQKQTIVFVPTIRMSLWLSFVYRLLFSCASLSSKSKDRDTILEMFRERKVEILFATTVLERGITIPDVQIVVFHSEHPVFSTASLIQMIGRAGRKKEYPDGKGLFLCTYITEAQTKCISELKRMNASLEKRMNEIE